MKSCFIRERQRYTKRQIADELCITLENVVELLRKLKSYGIVKAVNKGATIDFNDVDTIVADVDISLNDQLFVFDYVGVVTVGDYVFKIFPKYVDGEDDRTKALSQAIRAIKRYNAKEQVISFINGFDERSPFNLMAIMAFLIEDYVANGVYRNDVEICEISVDGDINWERTINEIDPFIISSKPYYLELFTQATLADASNFYTRLHTCITAECLHVLKLEGLTELLSIQGDVFYDGSLSDFGDSEYILYRLAKEMDAQFATRKVMLLKTMYAYIAEKRSSETDSVLSMYGTNSMNLVWEDACSTVFGDMLHLKLSELPISLAEDYMSYKGNELISLIQAPIWKAFLPNDKFACHKANETLIPDIVAIIRMDKGMCFAIFDAKYYCIRLDETMVTGQPGVGDVTKQYLYQLAFNDFITKHDFYNVVNAFLIPSNSCDMDIAGSVEMSLLSSVETKPGLQNVAVVRLPASKIYAWYLANHRIEVNHEFPQLLS